MPHEKVFKEIETECNRIDRLFQEYEPLLEKIKEQEPDFIEIGSLAMMLHSFYNGLENRGISARQGTGQGQALIASMGVFFYYNEVRNCNSEVFHPSYNPRNLKAVVFYLSLEVLNRNTAVIYSNLGVRNPIAEVFYPGIRGLESQYRGYLPQSWGLESHR